MLPVSYLFRDAVLGVVVRSGSAGDRACNAGDVTSQESTDGGARCHPFQGRPRAELLLWTGRLSPRWGRPQLPPLHSCARTRYIAALCSVVCITCARTTRRWRLKTRSTTTRLPRASGFAAGLC